MNAHLIEQLQSRRTSGARAPVKTLPPGLSPIEHFKEAPLAPSPLEAEPPIPYDLEFALQQCVECPDIDVWRQERFLELKGILDTCDTLLPIFSNARSPSSSRCSSHVNAVANALAAYSIRWPDSVTDLILQGACPLGNQEDFGIFRRKPTHATSDLGHLLQQGYSQRARIRARAPPPADQRQAIWAASCKEQEAGWLSEWMSEQELDTFFGSGSWVPIIRFAI